MPQGAPDNEDGQEFLIKELQSVRDVRSADLAALSASITKYHFIRVASFFVIALLISGADFGQPEWKRQDQALQGWIKQYARNQDILDMPYYAFSLHKYSKEKRDKGTSKNSDLREFVRI